MKTTFILIFAVGVAGVFSNPTPKQAMIEHNTESLLFAQSDLQTQNNEESTTVIEEGNENTNNEQQEDFPAEKETPGTAKFDIVIEESIGNPPSITHLPNENDMLPDFTPQDENEIPIGDDLEDTVFPVNPVGFYPDLVLPALPALPSMPGEMMETAEGFVPIPIFRRNKYNARRRMANRRVFWRNPYHSSRRFHFYPHYYYTRYYRPSSLRRRYF